MFGTVLTRALARKSFSSSHPVYLETEKSRDQQREQ